jgi:predicted ATP-dependent endonuclease of OLD family
MKVSYFTIKNFRGIESLENIELKDFSVIIGDNGTSKTAVLEAINFALSPSFLSGRIKLSDFHKGVEQPIEIILTFDEPFKAELPDGYQTQTIECDKVYLRIKKRERATPGKAFSDMVVVEHFVVPNFPPIKDKRWEITRKNGSKFKFDIRHLSFPVDTNLLPRSYYFGKNREKQIQKGFNSSITSVYDDFNWRFAKKIRNEPETDYYERKRAFENEIIKRVDINAIEKTFELLNSKLSIFNISPVNISFFESNTPFDSAFLNQIINNIELPVSKLGSGIEMIISLMFLETLASLSKDNIIILIDEPELHLHPKMQIKFVEYLKSVSNNIQIILNTHSPYFYKNCLANPNIELLISTMDNDKIKLTNTSDNFGLFPWSPSWGEINYFAFSLPTVEFHNELYGYIQESQKLYIERNIENYFEQNGIKKDRQWIRLQKGSQQPPYDVTLMTYIRNKIHHPENTFNNNFTDDDLNISIENMIRLINTNR